jgi:hypothetical protein
VSQYDEHKTDDCEQNHSREFFALDHMPIFLRCHNSGMGKIRPSCKGD